MVDGFDDVDATDKALAAFGLKAEKPLEPDHLDIWPENVEPFTVFRAMATQWSVGMNGPVGLRMEALAFALEMEGVPKVSWPEVTQAVRVMERETLRLWRKQQGA